MGKTNKIIEINGKRYDAVTGSFIGDSQLPAAARPAQTASRSGGSIDGFRRVSRDTGLTVLKPIPASHKTPTSTAAPKPAAARKPHNVAASAQPHNPQKGSTLMRTAVKKPAIESVVVIKARGRTDLLAKIPLQTIKPKISYNAVNKPRQQRAERMVKSPVINRYGSVVHPTAVPAVPAIAVPLPASHSIHHTDLSTSIAASASLAAARQTRQTQPLRQARPMDGLTRTPVTKSSVPAAAAPRATKKPDIFEAAIAKSDSHRQTYDKPKPTRRRGRLFGLLGGSAAVLLITGFAVYSNLPQLNFMMATHRSGVNATLPAYKPAGFAYTAVAAKPGNVTVKYSSKTGGNYDISQKESNWDSQALLANFVSSSAHTAYKTYERAGRTVYVMGDNTATWVDSGIWYTVNGTSLTSDQLLNLAASL